LFVLTGIMLTFGIACLVLSLPPPRPVALGLTLDHERLLAGAGGLALFVLSIGLVVAVVAQAARYGSAAQLAGQVVGSIRPIELLPGTKASRGGRTAGAVMLPVLELVTAATRDGDRPTFTRLFLEMRGHWADWLRCVPQQADRRAIVEAVYEGLLLDIPDLIARHGVASLHRIYVPACCDLVGETYLVDPNLIRTPLDHVERTLVTLIMAGEDEAAAPGVTALLALEVQFRDNESAQEDVHRVLGSVGRVVGHLVPAEHGFDFNAPGFGYLDDSRSKVMNELREGYYRMGEVREEAPSADDRCIWMEAIEVTIDSLLKRGIATGNYHAIREHAESLLVDLTVAAANLAYARCDRALNLCVAAIRSFCRLEIAQDQTALWSELAEYAVQLGMVAQDMDSQYFAGGSTADEAIGILKLIPGHFWNSAVLEGQLHSLVHGSDRPTHDSRWEFITRAGVKLHTNFGMMFDANTGDLYPDDDPRRR
jgi:hypothetical protein